MSRHVLIVGCGYIGAQIAEREIASDSVVHAIVSSDVSASSLKSKKINAFAVDLDQEQHQSVLPSVNYDVVYYAVAPQADGDVDRRIQNFFSLISAEVVVKKIVLISTTAVYGDCGGEWVDETYKPNPKAARGFRRLSAERLCEVWAKDNGTALAVLRVGGIYGPGKLPLARLQRGDPILAIDESPWSNRIYAKDLVEVCLRSSRRDVVGIVNVVDGNPSTMSEYFMKVADFAGITRPAQISMQEAQEQLGAGILSYLSESRRIGNECLIKELGEDCIRFPTLDKGLADIALG